MQLKIQIVLLFLIVTLASCSFMPDELRNAEQLIETNPDSALHILEKLNGKAIRGSYNRALYALLMSQAFDKQDIKIVTDSLITIATDYFDDSDPLHAGYAWFYHSRIANARGNIDEQAKNLLKANDYALKTTNNKLLGLINYDMATLHFNQRQYNPSILYFKISTKYFTILKDTDNIVLSNLYTGYSYLFLSKIDSAQIYYMEAKKIATKFRNKTLLSIIMRNIGTIYFQQGNYNNSSLIFMLNV